MGALRFAVVAVTAVFTTGVLGSACLGPASVDCGIPSPGETAVDGGPDPCHCDPPSSLNIQACPCLSGTLGEVDQYNACMFIYRGEMDAGTD